MIKTTYTKKRKKVGIAVMDVEWEAHAQASTSVAGGAALLSCVVPGTVRAHVAVTAWLKDGEPLAPIAAEAGRYTKNWKR